jgi:hypothetical protein
MQLQLEMLQSRCNSRSRPCLSGELLSNRTNTSNSGQQPVASPQMEIPQSRCNSRSRPGVTGELLSNRTNTSNSGRQLFANPQMEMPQPRSNSRSHSCASVQPPANHTSGNGSLQFIAHSPIELPQSRSTARPHRLGMGELPTSRICSATLTPGTSNQQEPQVMQSHHPSLLQKPLMMPGSSLQTNAALASVPVTRALSQDAMRSQSFLSNYTNIHSRPGQNASQGLTPAFPMPPSFQGPVQQFQFFPSSQSLTQAGDQVSSATLRPDEKDLPPPPRSAPAAFQNQSQTDFCGAEPPPPPRMAPANLQNFPSSVEVPPPPRCAPAAYQGTSGRSNGRGAIRPHIERPTNSGKQFTLHVQGSG